MVAHQVNISAMAGEFKPSGAGVIIRIKPDGEQQILGVQHDVTEIVDARQEVARLQSLLCEPG